MDRAPDLEYSGIALRGIGSGSVHGEVLLLDGPISFLGDVDPDTGMLSRDGRTKDISNKILIFTEGAGSTVGSYVVYNLKLNGKAPRAMVMAKADAIITIGCILGDIPLLHKVPQELWARAEDRSYAEIDIGKGSIRIWNDP